MQARVRVAELNAPKVPGRRDPDERLTLLKVAELIRSEFWVRSGAGSGSEEAHRGGIRRYLDALPGSCTPPSTTYTGPQSNLNHP